jgi:hypothetical protein
MDTKQTYYIYHIDKEFDFKNDGDYWIKYQLWGGGPEGGVIVKEDIFEGGDTDQIVYRFDRDWFKPYTFTKLNQTMDYIWGEDITDKDDDNYGGDGIYLKFTDRKKYISKDGLYEEDILKLGMDET